MLAFVSNIIASDIYVGASSSGSANGSDWDNKISWASVSFTRGNTYFLDTGTYTVSKDLNTAISGSSYIYIKNGGRGTVTFDTAYITIGTSYWDIDGITGGGPGTWTSGFGIVFNDATGGETNRTFIKMTASISHINIRHIEFKQTGDIVANKGTNGIAITPGTGPPYQTMDDCIFEYCYFHNITWLAWSFAYVTGSNNIIQYNYTGDICGAYDYSTDNHCETLVMHSLSNTHFRYNYIAECPSTGGFVKNSSGTTSDGTKIYGNVFAHRDGVAGQGKAIVANGPVINWRIFNNTIHNASSTWLSEGTVDFFNNTNYIYNNVLYYAGGTREPRQVTGAAGLKDYNWYSNATAGSSDMYSGEHDNICVTSESPNTGCASGDEILETSDVFVDSTSDTPESFKLSQAILDFTLNGDVHSGSGYNVCLIDSCEGEIKYNIDAFGITRGSDGVWDRGAYEYQSTSQANSGKRIGGSSSGGTFR